jgi:hypothetical protein
MGSIYYTVIQFEILMANSAGQRAIVVHAGEMVGQNLFMIKNQNQRTIMIGTALAIRSC